MIIFQLQTLYSMSKQVEADRQWWVHIWKKTVVAYRGVDLLSRNLKTMKTRQAICIYRNIEARSHFHCYRGKAMRFTYSEFVSVALVIQHTKCMRCIVIWPLWIYNIFPHYLINGTIFGKKMKRYWTEMCFDFIYNFCPKHCSLQEELSKTWS